MQTKPGIPKLIAASAMLCGLISQAQAQPASAPITGQPAWAYYTNTLTPDLKVTADTTKHGFIWKVFANQNNNINSRERTVAALNGRVTDAFGALLENLADTNANGIALAPAAPLTSSNATALFEIDTVINLNASGGGSGGNFTPDDQMPGVPATDASNSGVAAEVTTYLNLPAGVTTMGLVSDDAFWITAGKVDDAFDAIYVGARATGSETVFYLNVQEAGVYPFRIMYENGGGSAHIEWYTLKLLPDGTNCDRFLVNDTASGGIAAYRATTTPTPAYVKRVVPDPAPHQVNVASPSLVIELADGASSTVADASIALQVDGSTVTPSKSRNNGVVTVTYTPSGLQFPGDHHTAALTFTNSAGATRSKTWSFYGLKNIVLPAPVTGDNFDSYAEGDVPTGWNAWNYTDSRSAGLDLDNLNSDTYLGWVVVSKSRLDGLKGEIALPGAPNQFSNNIPVTISNLCQGNILYAESDVRGGNQVQFIASKAFDLSSVANPAVSFFNLYEQNQDNIGSVEYSVDGGNNWLPVVYYLDQTDRGGDIRLNPDGTINAVATFTNANTDTAVWTDTNSVAKGGNYGDGIAAPITQALARFIAPRNNDDPVFDKRLEIYRLPVAAHKSDVRLRFGQLGTGSWYFGIDNLCFYDVAAPIAPRLSLTGVSGGKATIGWTGDGTLFEATSPAGPWSISWGQGNPQTITVGTGAKFYKIGAP